MVYTVYMCMYADDAAACEDVISLREWWDELCLVGQSFGHFPNAAKSWLILKTEFSDITSSVFAGVLT